MSTPAEPITMPVMVEEASGDGDLADFHGDNQDHTRQRAGEDPGSRTSNAATPP